MPRIKGFTDKSTVKTRRKSFYSLWKGDTKGVDSAGKSLGANFRFECEDPDIYQRFVEFYGTDRPRKVYIYFDRSTTDDVCESYMAAYGTGLKHKCDGEKIYLKVDKKEGMSLGKSVSYRELVDCDEPCKKPKGTRKCNLCGPELKLRFQVRELFGMGMGTLTVHGDRDVTSVTAQLDELEEQYGDLNRYPEEVPGFLHHGRIPYVLQKVKARGTTPYQRKGTFTEFWDVAITVDPDWLELVRMCAAAREMQKLQESDPIQLKVLLAADERLKLEKYLPDSTATPVSNWSAPFWNEIENHRRRLGWSEKRLDEEAISIYQVKSCRHIREEDLRDFVSHLSRKQPEISRDVLIAKSDKLIAEIAELEGKDTKVAQAEWREVLKSEFGKNSRGLLLDKELENFLEILRIRKFNLENLDDDAIDVEAIDPEFLSEPTEGE